MSHQGKAQTVLLTPHLKKSLRYHSPKRPNWISRPTWMRYCDWSLQGGGSCPDSSAGWCIMEATMARCGSQTCMWQANERLGSGID